MPQVRLHLQSGVIKSLPGDNITCDGGYKHTFTSSCCYLFMYSLWQGDTCYHLHPTHRRWKDLSFVYYKYSDSLKWLNTSRCVSFVCSPHLLLHSAGARGRGFPLHLSFITHSSAALHDPALHLTVAPDCSVSSGDSPANFPRDSSRVLLCCLLRPCSPKRPLK